MEQNEMQKKMRVIGIAGVILLVFIIIFVIYILKPHKEKDQIVPPLNLQAEPILQEPLSNSGKPVDYTDDTFEFTEDMPDIVLSHNHYFYDHDFTLKIYSRKPAEIRYTTDGTHPTRKSALYTEEKGILLRTGPASTKVYPLHLIAYYEDGTESEEIIHSFMVGTGVFSRYENLLIFNISGDPLDLTEGPDGIFYGKNYELRGMESERSVYVEILNHSGEEITSQQLGVRINGAYNRQNSQKSMKFFARRKYSPASGTTYLSCFDLLDPTGSQIVRYDRFVLRASGNDFRFGFIRDELNQSLAKEAGFDTYEPVFPAIAYVNGEYFGFYWLHASYCDKYFKNLFGPSPAEKAANGMHFEEGEFSIVAGSEQHKEIEEDDEQAATIATDFNTSYAEFSAMDLTNDTNYDLLCRWLDVENYLDYMAYNIYLCNKDWPNNNVRCYRYFAAAGESYGEGSYDGRWRYLLHDMDYTLGLYEQEEVQYTYDTLKEVLYAGSERCAPLLIALLKRDDCREYFIRKSLDFGAGVLSYSSIASKLKSMNLERQNEMHYYYKYLKTLKGSDVNWIAEEQFSGFTALITDFAEMRPNSSANFLKKNFGLKGSKYNLIVNGAEGCKLVVGSSTLREGINLNGIYLSDFDTTVSVLCSEQKAFDHWEVNGKVLNTETITITEDLIQDNKVTVVLYTKDKPLDDICISEFCVRNGDYVTITNRTGQAVSLNGYVLSDGNYAYRFTDEDMLSNGQSITVYGNDYENVPEEGRKAIFNLSEGETLTLKRNDGTTVSFINIPKAHSGFVFRRNSYTGSYEEVQP